MNKEGKLIMTKQLDLYIEKLDDTLPDPSYAHTGDAGIDLYARETIVIQPGARATVPLGVRCEFPEGSVGFVLCKSGLAFNQGLSQVNCCGVIDEGYRGELNFIAYNSDSDTPIVLEKGKKCCQLVVLELPRTTITFKEISTDTSRGEGKFGSTTLD